MIQKTHTVKRAIIVAAGIGERMKPLTFETPKPLVKVNGVRMIDTQIHGLHENGIKEIYVVVGYLKEKFCSLPSQYPGLQLIENPYYDTFNNISSLYVAREYLGDCIILDGDQIEGKTNEWLMTVEGGVVQSCSLCTTHLFSACWRARKLYH